MLTPLLSLALGLLAGPQESGAAPVTTKPAEVKPGLAPGPWRAVLESPGGELPFGLLVGDDGLVQVLNGRERIPVTTVHVEDGEVLLEFPHYDSRIEATLSTDGKLLAGTAFEYRDPDGRQDLVNIRLLVTVGTGPPLDLTPLLHPVFGWFDLGETEDGEGYRFTLKTTVATGAAPWTVSLAATDRRGRTTTLACRVN